MLRLLSSKAQERKYLWKPSKPCARFKHSQRWEITSSQWQCFRPLSYQGWPKVLRNSLQSVTMPYTTLLLGQAHSGKRQRAVSDKATDHLVIRAGPGSGERQQAVSSSALDHSAIMASPQWWETASSQWQCLGPLSYQSRPTVVRDSE